MKLFIALLAVILTVHGLPVENGLKPKGFTDASVLISNGTLRIPAGQAGFATMHGGTTGGAGGAVWTVWDAFAFRDAINSNDRRVIYVRGRIDLTALFTNSPGVSLHVGSFTTLIGGDASAMIFGGGIRIQTKRQVIVQNIKFHNALSYAAGERPDGNGGIVNMNNNIDFSTIDAIGIDEFSENIWVDHCEFADDPWNSRVGRRRHDGLIDITQAASYISISNNIFRNHNLVTLVGNDDNNHAKDGGRLKITFYLNWYQGTNQRNPLVRFGEVHLLNNYYTDITDYGIAAETGAQIFCERNMMINARRAWTGSLTAQPRGALFDLNNWLHNSPPHNNVPARLNWNPTQYYRYTAMAAANVENHVRRFAGTW